MEKEKSFGTKSDPVSQREFIPACRTESEMEGAVHHSAWIREGEKRSSERDPKLKSGCVKFRLTNRLHEKERAARVAGLDAAEPGCQQ